MQSPAPNIYTIAIMVVVFALVLGLRARRMSRPVPLRTGSLIIIPVLFAMMGVGSLMEFPPSGYDWLWIGLSLAVGAVLGWYRGKLMKIWIDPDTGKTMMQGSMLALIFLIVLIVGRAALRMGLDYEAQAGALDAGLVSNLFVFFAMGLFGVQRIEMAIRAKALREKG